MPAIKPPVTVDFDIPVNRRLTIHSVRDGAGVEVFHTRKLDQVFDFLIENDVGHFQLIDESRQYLVSLSRKIPRKRSTKGTHHG